ncbi:hypothetical protein NKY66_10855 [Sinorhizobium meliloti]|uniref:hypothetical protein n=1 Tax=Rhizobium meliloti TaxID=382 RepID=UPI003D655CDE
MWKDPAKEAIRQHFIARQVAREATRLAEIAAEIEDAIENTVVETRMPIEEAVAFIRAGGERHDVFRKH